MSRIGVLSIILPELNHCVGVKQDPKYHKYDVFKHGIYTCDNIEPVLELRWAAILHDIGKPDTKEKKGGRVTFHKHEVVGANLARVALERLRFKKQVVSEVVHLIRLHMYHYTRDFTDTAVRRFIKNANIKEEDLNNIENLPLFKLRKAERKGNGFKTIPITERQHDFEKRIVGVFKGSSVFDIKDLDINGEELMRVFNIGPSKTIGDVLNHLVEKILEDPKLNTRDELIKLAAQYLYYQT
jgi:poly(A) polymerase/tRNA nucleotidyltransferase (CCA-adding enzyme)